MTESARRILLVDDDPLVADSLATVLERAGFAVDRAATGSEALARVDVAIPDVVVSDVRLPDLSGVEVLERLAERMPRLPVIMITAYGTIDDAVRAMRAGARDYLAKPIDDFDLLQRIRRALDEDDLVRENAYLRRRVRDLAPADRLIAGHPSMQRVMTVVDAVAGTRATVLINGESGTGKTILARALHDLSERRQGPFIEVSCGSLPDPLLESELFGYEKGAFTGAERAKPGKFEVADGGTVFLDEIANASPALQVKLLRILQDRVFERLGGNESRRTDVRLVLATNSDLEERVRSDRFREDLYYRINVVNIHLPPLRERASDIPELADLFLRRFARDHGRRVTGFEPDVLASLCSHGWPGNVRELENVVEHAVVLGRQPLIRVEDLPQRYRATRDSRTVEASPVQPLKQAMELPEREYILRALKLAGGNRQRTAEMLCVNRTTLFNKMKKYDLFSEDMAE